MQEDKNRARTIIAVMLCMMMSMWWLNSVENRRKAELARQQEAAALEALQNQPEVPADDDGENPPPERIDPGAQPDPGQPPAEIPAPEYADDIRIEGEKYTAVFSNHGGILRSLYLNPYKHVVDKPDPYRLIHDEVDGKPIPYPAFSLLPYVADEKANVATLDVPNELSLNDLPWTVTGPEAIEEDATRLTFQVDYKGFRFKKIYTLRPDSDVFLFTQEITNLGEAAQSLGYRVYPVAGLHHSIEDKAEYNPIFGKANSYDHDDYRITYLQKPNKGLKESDPKQDYFVEDYPVQWAGVHNLYFIALLQLMPKSENQADIAAAGMSYLFPNGPVSQESANPFLGTAPTEIKPGETLRHEYRMFAGPRKAGPAYDLYDLDRMKTFILFRWLDFIAVPAAHLLTNVLMYLHAVTFNYGIAIIMLTLMVRSMMHPLSRKQYRSMRVMSLLAPRMQALKTKYKNDKQKFNTELMKMYQEYGVNPLGGCLPMIIQMPIFFGLWRGIRYTLELRHSSFLWIQDLARPDHLFDLPFALPMLGSELNILPLFFIGSMFWQMRLQPRSEDPQQRQQQVMMMYMMPAMMLFIFYTMPAGLTLYFVASNIYGIVEAKINKRSFDNSDLAKKLAVAS